MNRRLWALIVALALGLGGCQLAREEEGMGEERRDRLIGALVTTQVLDLFDMDAYLRSRIWKNGEEIVPGADAPRGRLWAQASRVEKSGGTAIRYDFPQVKGYLCVLETVSDTLDGDDVISSRIDPPLKPTGLATSQSDSATSYDLSATLYMAPGGRGHAMYVNPVYQTPDGRAYVLEEKSGFSASLSDSLGEVITSSFSDAMTVSTAGREIRESVSVAITLTIKNAPRQLTVLQMSPSHQVLRRDEYGPDTLPDSIRPLDGCAYLLSEVLCVDRDGGEARERLTYEKGATYLPFYIEEQSGVLREVQLPIIWP